MTSKTKSEKSAGYSGTPLAKKLGIKETFHVVALNAPSNYLELLEPLPNAVVFGQDVDQATDLVHVFVSEREDLANYLGALRHETRPDVPVWISWPKKSSGVPSTVTEDTIRELALPIGFVDIKVCAVDTTWSGLKLVVRKELR